MVWCFVLFFDSAPGTSKSEFSISYVKMYLSLSVGNSRFSGFQKDARWFTAIQLLLFDGRTTINRLFFFPTICLHLCF